MRRTVRGFVAAFAGLAAIAALAAFPAQAQDTTKVLDQGVRVGITYQPGVRPGIIVLPAPGADSAHAIIARDLDFSDRFDVIAIPAAPAATATKPGTPKPKPGEPNYGLYRSFGAQFAVELTPGAAAGGGIGIRLLDLGAGRVRNEQAFELPPSYAAPGFRMAMHRIADEIVRWVTGTPGAAASRLLFVTDGRLYRVDSDGANLAPVTLAGPKVLSSAWSPDGSRIAYTVLGEGRGPILLRPSAGGSEVQVPSTNKGLNFAPAFAPDGRGLAFARSDENGTDIFSANVADQCCVQRLTAGRFADNLSPTYSPDGRRIAFVSTRAGSPQLYVMGSDGTDQELLAPFDAGETGGSYAPDWSPDGANIAFHREVAGTPQVFIVDAGGRRVRQLTSSGRNEDASWAADGRHLAFVSDRSGRRQIWVIDLETGRLRQIMTPGAVRLPAWSRRLGPSALPPNP